jgi:phosphoribosylaminoimidazolecarboxamide formyltransferase/IMP cyclohydrolase
MLDGRVKTLHPKVHGGFWRFVQRRAYENRSGARNWLIDMVIVNLYPFFENVNKEYFFRRKSRIYRYRWTLLCFVLQLKNFFHVTVITDVGDYAKIQENETGNTQLETRKKLAGKVFNLTSAYDAAISKMLLDEEYPNYLNASSKKFLTLDTVKIHISLQLTTFLLSKRSDERFRTVGR